MSKVSVEGVIAREMLTRLERIDLSLLRERRVSE